MENNEKFYNVKNRSTSHVTYRIPEDNIRREFAPGESKRLSFEELEKLSFQAGGRELMSGFLQIQNEEAIKNLGIHTEPEYNMSEQDVVDLIKVGSLDAFLDCLDFAPVGVIDLIKTLSISLPMSDYAKRKALKEKTGFDVDVALKNLEADKADEEAAEPVRERRVTPAEAPTGRRTAPGNYKVITKKEE